MSGPVGKLPGLVLFFGTVQSEEFIDGLGNRDETLGLLRDAGNTLGSFVPSRVRTVASVDFARGPDAVCAVISDLRQSWNLRAVLNIDEYTVALWAEVCSRLGLAATSPESAALTRSKSGMREVFGDRLAAEASTAWCRIGSAEDLERFAVRSAERPLVLKPDGLFGSYFVSLCRDRTERKSAVAQALREIPGFYASRRIGESPALMAEVFLAGTNHSVECLVSGGRVWTTPVIDVLTGFEVGHGDFHHFARVAPSRLSAAVSASVRDLAADAVRALGLDNCAAHVEVVVGPDGPALLEVGARVGGNRVSVLRRAYGIRYMRALVMLLQGGEPDVMEHPAGGAAVITPYPTGSGVLRAIRHMDEIRSLPSTAEILPYRSAGAPLKPRGQGGGPALRIELSSPAADEVRADVDHIAKLLPDLFDIDEGDAVPPGSAEDVRCT